MKNLNLLKIFSFISLIIIATLVLINNVLPLVGIEISGVLFSVLDFVKNILIIIVVGSLAYTFTVGKKNYVKVIYYVSLAVYIIGMLLLFIPR